MNTAAIVQSFMTGTYTVTRTAASTFTAGRAVPGSTSTVSIMASVQPAAGKDLLRLAEGRRTEETRVVFTDTQLKDGAEGSAYEADRVSIDGQDWEVQQIESWRGDPLTPVPYFRCIVQAAAT